MMMDSTSQLLDNYKAQLSAAAPTPEIKGGGQDEELQAYLSAAAVLNVFMPEKLNPLDARFKKGRARLVLFDHLIIAPGGIASGLFTLKPSSRREALGKLGTPENMLKALQSDPSRIVDSLQQLWEDYLENGSFGLFEDMSYQELMNADQIASWLPESFDLARSRALITELLKVKSIVLDFEHLCTSDFTGREAELAILRDHGKGYIQPIYAIYGPGGIGKSALIGRFLSDRVSPGPDFGFFAYLAFDQTSLRIDAPYTILVEVVQQFRNQHPSLADYADGFLDSVNRFRNLQGEVLSKSFNYQTRGARIGSIEEGEQEMYYMFSRLVGRLRSEVIGGSDFVIVLDTFEEVQYRDRESLGKFWGMLDFLIEMGNCPGIIIAGRNSVKQSWLPDLPVTEINLGQLEFRDQLLLLHRLGVKDERSAELIAGKVGGNPLSLKLAANLFKKMGAGRKDGTFDFADSSMLLEIDEEIIQGQLYRRLLDHIHDEKVRVLAHPGMVLRVISPELIMEVLARVCKIEVEDIHEATVLYEKLKAEHTLVRISDTGLLQYRPEVRSAMIRLLTQDRYAEVREIHARAVSYYYYKDSLDVADRAEELYHRLVLGRDSYQLLDSRWLSGIEQSIRANLEEYSDRIKIWLASRLSLEVSRSIFQYAEVEDWERNVTRKIKQSALLADTENAMSLLRERRERSENSPLFALEAKVAILADELNHAEVVILQGLERLAASGNRGRIAELYWLQAQVYLYKNQYGRMDQSLAKAQQSIKNAVSRIPLIQVVSHRIMLRQRYYTNHKGDLNELRSSLSAALTQIDTSVPYYLEFIPRLGAALLEEEFPRTIEHLATFVDLNPGSEISYDMLGTESLRGLEEFREEWEEESDDNVSFESYI
jgi:hypothetical protein